MNKKKRILSFAAIAEREFKRLGYNEPQIVLWCIREAYDTYFLRTPREFVTYAVALYEAQLWADNQPLKSEHFKDAKEKADNLCTNIINLLIGKNA